MTASSVERKIGLAGAVFTLVGYVIGASIFILPGQLAAEAGPGSVLAYLIAGVLAAIACVAGAAIGSAVPVSGAANVAAARVLAPIFGFMGVWLILVAVAISIALVGFGLADYLDLPGLHELHDGGGHERLGDGGHVEDSLRSDSRSESSPIHHGAGPPHADREPWQLVLLGEAPADGSQRVRQRIGGDRRSAGPTAATGGEGDQDRKGYAHGISPVERPG